MKKKLAIALSLLMLLTILAGCETVSDENASGKTTDFPKHSLTLICNFGAGGGYDLTSRALATAMEKTLGVPVAVEDKPGGSGTLGVQTVKNSKADGYTFGVTSFSALCISPFQMEVDYSIDDFRFLGTVTQNDYGILVRADSPINSVEDLVEKANNGGVIMMAAGYPHPLVCEGLAELTGADIQFVNCDSSAEVVTNLLGEHCDAISLTLSDAVTYIEAGELKLIASSMVDRWYKDESVPTLIESGYDLSICAYYALGVPAGVGDAEFAILQDAFNKALQDPEFMQAMENLNMHVAIMSGEEYEATVRKAYDEYKAFFAAKEQQ